MTPAADSNALGTYLRARREQARPEAAGVPDQRNRRVPGLRREEVAFLAGVSSDYYVRLEQGRDKNPSDQVLLALFKDDYSLTRTREWATLGMRGTVSAGFALKAEADPVTTPAATSPSVSFFNVFIFERDDIVTVTEDEIRESVRILSSNPKTLAEPSGAVAPAAFLFHASELPDTKINVAVISGGNIDPKVLAAL